MARPAFLGYTSRLAVAVSMPRRMAEEQQEEGGPVAQDVGGVIRVQTDGDPEAQARANAIAAGGTGEDDPNAVKGDAEVKLPEGYDSWEAYGKDVAAGKVKPAEVKAETVEGELSAEDNAAIDTELQGLPEENREKARPHFEAFAKQGGTLTDAQVEAAAKDFGVTPEMVRVYMAGYQAEQQGPVNEFYSVAGGEEQYKAFGAWAEQGGLTAEQMAAYNDALGAGEDKSKANPALAKELLAKHIETFKAQGNTTRRDLTKGQSGEQAVEETGYASMAEQKADQADPRYAKDSAFRARVEAKIARSTYTH